MKHLFVSLIVAIVSLSLAIAGCSQAAPPAPTQAPAKAAEPTKAPASSAPTAAPAAAPAPTKAAEPAKATWPQPGKTITLIIPWGVGGSTDIGMRVVAPGMEKILGTKIDLVNKPGGGSQVGASEVLKAKPDGYTIGALNQPGTGTIYLDPDRQSTFGRKDIQPIANRVFDPVMVVTRPDAPYKSVKDLVDAAKANPGKINVSTSGIGSVGHLAMLMLQKAAGVQFSFVPFDNQGQMRAALLGGHVDAETGTGADFVANVKTGEVRGLAAFMDQRSKFMPDIPTAQEQGFNVNLVSAHAIAGPAGMPPEAVAAISSALKQALQDPDVIKKHDEVGIMIRYMDTAEFTQYWDQVDENLKAVLPELKKK